MSRQPLELDKNQTLQKSYMVMAGAGAGKTTRLVKHIVENFLSFKKEHHRWPRIVGTTFTKKAASEIQDRVSLLYKDYEDAEIFDFAYSSHLNIGTIHSLCFDILRKKAQYLGFSKRIKIITAEEIKLQKNKILYEVLNSDFKELLYYYNFSQITSVIEFFESHQEIEFQPVDISFQKKLALDKFNQLKFSFQEKFEFINSLEIPKKAEKGFVYLNQLNQVFNESEDLREIFVFFKDNKFNKPPFKFDLIEEQNAWLDIWKYRNEVKTELEKKYFSYFDMSSFLILSKNAVIFKNLFNTYLRQIVDYKKLESVIEMSDIEFLTLDLLKKHQYQCRDVMDQVDFYYIDEYQDTSLVQKEIFSILLENTSFFKVGDPQQSIYLFRGAKSSIFKNEFEIAEENENIHTEFLSTNYRSSKNLLLAVNEIFQHIDPDNFREMIPYDQVEDNTIRFKVIQGLDEVTELSKALEIIKEKISLGVNLSDICVLAKTRAILHNLEIELQKMNIPSVSLVSGNFKNRPEIRECLAFLSFLEEPNDDKMLCSLFRNQSFRLDDLEIVKLMSAARSKKAWSLWDFLNKEQFFDKNLDNEKFSNLLGLKSYFDLYNRQGLAEAFKIYLVKSKILFIAKNSIDLNRRHSNLIKLLTEILSNSLESANLSLSLKSILIKDSKSQASEAIFSDSDQGVRLMTIHGSKGLEFDEVIVLGCHRKGNLTYSLCVEFDENGRFVIPYRDFEKNITIGGPLLGLSSKLRVESERREILRLIYVAATRAKHNLYLLGQKKVFDNSIFKNLGLTNSKNFNYIDLIGEKTNPTLNNTSDKLSNTSEDKLVILDSNSVNIDSVTNIESDDDTDNNEDALEGVTILEPNRIWDEISYLNQQMIFGQPIDPETNSKLVLLNNNIKSLDPIENISVTSLIHRIKKLDSKINYKVIHESEFQKLDIEKIKLRNSSSLRPYGFKNMNILIGEIYHKYLELFAKGVSKDFLNIRFKSTYLGDMTDIGVTLDSMLKINSPSFKELLISPKIEWGFNSLVTSNILISGQIDLWGFDNKGVIHILDYKTGESGLDDKAALQVLIYELVLRKIYPEAEIKTHIMYLSEGKIKTLKFEPDSNLKMNQLFELI